MENLRAVGLMILAMLFFAITDMFIKLGTATLPVAQIVLILSVGGAILFGLLALRAGQPLLSPAFTHPAILSRNGFEVFGTLCFTGALAVADLSFVSAVAQATPLVVVLAAALVLGERVGPRRWAAVIVGLLGVLLMIQPTAEGISFGALLTLGAVIGLSGRDIATRRVPAGTGNFQLATWAFVVLIPASLIALWAQGGPAPMTLRTTAFSLCAVVTGAVAYWSITAAMRQGEVSLVAPYRYTRLVFALVIGILVFGERPDAMTLIGAAIVIASGLFVFLRERALSRRVTSG